MQVHALSSTRAPLAPAAAPAPPPAAAPSLDPIDELTRSSPSQASAPPSGNPWTELQALGLLSTPPGVPGPIGAALTDSARQGLLAAMERVQAGGVKLERTRRFRLPFVMDKHVPVTPGEAMERIAKSQGEIKRLRAQAPGQATPLPIRGLADLRLLDGAHGAGAAMLAGDGAARLEALRSLAGQKATFSTQQYAYYEESRLSPLEAYRSLEDGQTVWCTLDREAVAMKGSEGLFALDYFQGSGQDRGLKDPGRAAQIRAASQKGLRFLVNNREATARQVYEAPAAPLAVCRQGSRISIPMEAKDLLDPDGLEARLADWEKVFGKHVGPALAAARMEDWSATVSQHLYPEDALLGPEVRCAIFGEIFAAVARERNRDTVETALQVYRALREGAASAYEVARNARLVLPRLREAGTQAGLALMEETRAALGARAFRADLRADLEDTFFRLLQATGSVEAAYEGIDLVRIPVGNERPEERLGLFLALAARESESSLHASAEHYRGLLVHRAPQEGLMRTGERFLRLLEGLAVGRHQDRALQVFAAIQEDLRAGRIDSSAADERVETFLRNMALSNDVDRALEASLGAPDRPPGEIAEQDEFVEIGGVRIPRQEKA